jgi:hypothetical protein
MQHQTFILSLLLADLLYILQKLEQRKKWITINKRHLFSILVIAKDFAPEAYLKETAQKLLPEATALI